MSLRASAREARFAIDRGKARRLRALLLPWFEQNGRSFFWREPGLTPYAVLVTEILLAKTRAELVATTARELLDRCPTPVDLANVSRRELERLLFPLGLQRKRAKHLIDCAKALVRDFDGRVPNTVEKLMQLPYIGRYAANAIACVAFEQHVPVIDANVSRIYQRVFSLPDPPDRLANAHALWTFAGTVLPRRRAKSFNWAILDLGGTICTAKSPACSICPLAAICEFRANVPASRPVASERRGTRLAATATMAAR